MQFDRVGAHDDVVNDIAFDFYGRRFATCSSDKNIRVWDLETKSNSGAVGDAKSNYSCSEISRAHQSSIWRLSWAHPEFGQLLASCSEDRTTCIWEEQESIGGGGEYIKKNERTNSSRQMVGQRWQLKTTLSESRKSVNDVEFAPRHLGLKIATASADGFVRVYEAPDVFSLNMWQLEHSVEVEQTVPAPLSSQPAASGEAGATTSAGSSKSEHGLTCLTWNVCPFEPAKLAVGGYSSRAVVLTQDSGDIGGSNKWREECVLGEHTGIIHDIAWAPAMGRSYHLIATASREPSFKVHTLQRLENGALEYTSTQAVEAVGHSAIWRVAWNATGTVLATSSEDGIVALWRKDFLGVWKCVQEISEKVDVSAAAPNVEATTT